MDLLRHAKLLPLLAYSTIGNLAVLVTPLMRNGNLKQFLRGCRPGLPKLKERVTFETIISVANQVAAAGAYVCSYWGVGGARLRDL